MECYIRKNHMTINEQEEIYEVVSYENNNVVWWGSESKLSKRLGRTTWQAGNTIIWK